MDGEVIRKCGHCAYWAKGTKECRRYSPSIHGQLGWPNTHSHDWCGEFKSNATPTSKQIEILERIGITLDGLANMGAMHE